MLKLKSIGDIIVKLDNNNNINLHLNNGSIILIKDNEVLSITTVLSNLITYDIITKKFKSNNINNTFLFKGTYGKVHEIYLKELLSISTFENSLKNYMFNLSNFENDYSGEYTELFIDLENLNVLNLVDSSLDCKDYKNFMLLTNMLK